MSEYETLCQEASNYGWTQIAELEHGGSWEFDTFLVYAKGEKFFWAMDSGCSCPEPFENLSIEDCEKFDIHNLHVIESALKNYDASASERIEVMEAIQKWAKEQLK